MAMVGLNLSSELFTQVFTITTVTKPNFNSCSRTCCVLLILFNGIHILGKSTVFACHVSFALMCCLSERSGWTGPSLLDYFATSIQIKHKNSSSFTFDRK